ncbi:hypothetical protein HYPSUDRAFT_206741 [Hypholoma sublateritium FD-334 SS-4]|uniref:Uncharacterized protein n=1 Tax=Hypholoma sublateritium (strain FD-334 SS-4) TaxID=945553 RepID=A0A0D2P910_HYPSF|nr:hypothetical protein HYPSUDRAFT_206741 [Hypholoma sublateritium FD-334 SS-4]
MHPSAKTSATSIIIRRTAATVLYAAAMLPSTSHYVSAWRGQTTLLRRTCARLHALRLPAPYCWPRLVRVMPHAHSAGARSRWRVPIHFRSTVTAVRHPARPRAPLPLRRDFSHQLAARAAPGRLHPASRIRTDVIGYLYTSWARVLPWCRYAAAHDPFTKRPPPISPHRRYPHTNYPRPTSTPPFRKTMTAGASYVPLSIAARVALAARALLCWNDPSTFPVPRCPCCRVSVRSHCATHLRTPAAK